MGALPPYPRSSYLKSKEERKCGLLGPTSGPGQPCFSWTVILVITDPTGPAGVFESAGNNPACDLGFRLKLISRIVI